MRNKKAVATICALLLAAMVLLTATFAARKSASSRAEGASNNTPQSITVKINAEGYQPASINLQRDRPARLTFVRQTDKSCGKELVIPEYDIRRALPLNVAVVVEVTPRKS